MRAGERESGRAKKPRFPDFPISRFPDLPISRLSAAAGFRGRRESYTPARWTLLERLRAAGSLSVNELARRLQRDYKNVHGDVKRLAELGLIKRRKDALVSVAWDVVRAEVRLAA